MNTAIIRQILEESRKIPDEVLRFGVWYSNENGVVTMCPIGRHILNHPEIAEKLGVKSNMTMCRDIKEVQWDVSSFSISKYLDIEFHESDFLFGDLHLTRELFEANIEQFLAEEISIRECQGENCDIVFVTSPDEKCVVCDDCKGWMLDMCGE